MENAGLLILVFIGQLGPFLSELVEKWANDLAQT
jgi:hypothetical protein